MKYVDSPRRQIVMAVLLSLAAIGLAIRHWAPNPSLARDMGTLMLVLWLPAVGNFVAFAIARIPRRGPRVVAFDDAAPFKADLVARMQAMAAHSQSMASLPAGCATCTLVVGKEGFTARAASPWTGLLPADSQAREIPLQLLRPSHALRRLPAGTHVDCMVGEVVVANGRVIRVA